MAFQTAMVSEQARQLVSETLQQVSRSAESAAGSGQEGALKDDSPSYTESSSVTSDSTHGQHTHLLRSQCILESTLLKRQCTQESAFCHHLPTRVEIFPPVNRRVKTPVIRRGFPTFPHFTSLLNSLKALCAFYFHFQISSNLASIAYSIQATTKYNIRLYSLSLYINHRTFINKMN